MRCAGNGCRKVNWCSPCAKEPEVEQPHVRERFYVGPKTTEIVLDLIRARGVGLPTDYAVELRVRRHLCGEQPVAVLKPYAVDEGTFYFRMEGEFMSDAEKYPRGFYVGSVYWGDCLLDSIEIVKAQMPYIGAAMATSDQCVTITDWKEPECVKPECPEPPEHLQGCDCAECRRRKKHYLMKRKPGKRYVTDLEGLWEEMP